MPDYDITPDLAPHVDLYKWEQHLSAAHRRRLALYRSVAAEDEALEGAFYVELQARREGWEFQEALDDTGDDAVWQIVVALKQSFYRLYLERATGWV